MNASPSVRIIDYQPEHQQWFENLNRAWIEKFFWMEDIDVAVLKHPDQYILANGGKILMALYEERIVGTVALKFSSPGVYEFTKMAVDENYHGLKIGRALADAALHCARSLNAKNVILYSNTRLETAIALYRKLGFVEIPLDGIYKRSDIKMELVLS